MTDPIRQAIEHEREKALADSTERRRVNAAFEEYLRTRNRSPAVVLMEKRDAMAEALAYQMGGPEPEMPEAERYAGLSFHAQVESLLTMRGVVWNNSLDLVSRGITTGDVAELLTGAGNRILRKAFETYRNGLLAVATRAPSRDFRDVKLIQVGGDLSLAKVTEGGPFTRGSVKASAETYAIETWGKIFGVTHTLLLDDDLGAFSTLAQRFGEAAAEVVSAKLATVLEANGNLSDGVAVFAAGHANLGTGGALSETTLGELTKLMRSQRGLSGERISAVPHALVVPSALEVPAMKLVTSLGNPSPFAVVVEPRLTSATAFYVVADPAAGLGLSLTFPSGSEAPTIELRSRPTLMGLDGKVRFDFGAGIADYRGLTKNPGA